MIIQISFTTFARNFYECKLVVLWNSGTIQKDENYSTQKGSFI